jgi:hypothetical protein
LCPPSFITNEDGPPTFAMIGSAKRKTVSLCRRRARLTVTDAGHDLLDELSLLQQRVNDVQFDCLSAEEFQSLLDTIDRLVQSGDKAVALQRYLAADAI